MKKIIHSFHLLFICVLFLAGFVSTSFGAETLLLKCLPEREYFTHAQKEDVVIKIDVTAIQPPESELTRKRLPLNLAIVLDRSGSMAGQKLEQAKKAACLAIDQLKSEDTVSVIVYDDIPETLVKAQPVGNKEKIKSKINQIKEGNSTAIYASLKQANREMEEFLSSKRINRILLLSDGLANVGPSSPNDFAELGASLRHKGIVVTTIGLGDDYNEDLMMALAEASNGNYYYVKDTEKLPGIFAEELRLVKSVVARNVKIVITVPQGVRPIEIIGYPQYRFRGQTVEIPLADLTAGQNRYFFLRCAPPVEKDKKTTVRVVDVRIEAEDAFSNKQVSLKESGAVAFTSSDEESVKSIRAEVAKPLALTRSRLANERAVTLADEGKHREAAKVLREQAAVNAALPAEAQSEELEADSNVLSQRAESISASGSVPAGDRKAMKYDAYKAKESK